MLMLPIVARWASDSDQLNRPDRFDRRMTLDGRRSVVEALRTLAPWPEAVFRNYRLKPA